MAWDIEFDRRAEKEFAKLAKPVQRQIMEYLIGRVLAAKDPRQFGKALKGTMTGLWRYRVDKYRIICRLEEDALIILVLRIAKRDTVYE